MDLQSKVLVARSLRKSFNQTRDNLLQDHLDFDTVNRADEVLKAVKEMQEQYRLFNRLTTEIKEQDRDIYSKEILGI